MNQDADQKYLNYFVKQGDEGNLGGLHAEAYSKYKEVQETQNKLRDSIATLRQQVRQAQDRIQQLDTELHFTVGRGSGILDAILLLDRVEVVEEGK